jgi:alpha-glucosidase
VYLPAGEWIDWFSGKHYAGSQTIEHQADAERWSDIPLYIREGAIIPMAPVMDHVGQHPLTELEVELFPAASGSQFDYYDDDGTSYGYERGQFFLQPLRMQGDGDTVRFVTEAPQGSFKPALASYLLKFHGRPAQAVVSNGRSLEAFASADALRSSEGEGWASGRDRFGEVTWVKLDAGQARELLLTLAGH